MDDFTYQVRLSQIENCTSVQELETMFNVLLKHYTYTNHIYGDGCANFNYKPSSTESYTKHYEAILVVDLLGNIYNRLIDSKQMTPENLKSLLTKPFHTIDKEQAIKNLKAFHGFI